MNPPMAVITQPRKVVEPVRVRPTPPCDVMHARHRTLSATLTQATLALPDLHPADRVHRVALPTLVADRLHSSSAIARLNSSKSTCTISATSRIDIDIPPAWSHCTNIGTNSSGQ